MVIDEVETVVDAVATELDKMTTKQEVDFGPDGEADSCIDFKRTRFTYCVSEGETFKKEITPDTTYIELSEEK